MRQLSIVSQQQLRRWFWLLLVLNALYITGSRFYLQPLTGADMVRFELAKKMSVAEGILQEWQSSGKYSQALPALYIDFLFILLYTSGLSVACVYLSRLTKHEIMERMGRLVSYLLIVAGICDVIENLALIKNLRNTVSNWNVVLAYDMAAGKFSIIILSILFLFICLVFWGLEKISYTRM
jgi:hypothetical protein